MYTIDMLEYDIKMLVKELSKVRAEKGHDYSGTKDTFANLRQFGSFGVLVRIGDKFNRLKNFYEQGTLAVNDEKVEDSMQDLINYALFLLLMHRQELGLGVVPAKVVPPDAFDPIRIEQTKAEACGYTENITPCGIYNPFEKNGAGDTETGGRKANVS